MKQIVSEQLVENKKNDSIIKISTIKEEYKIDDNTFVLYGYNLEEYFKKGKEY